jgi:hypothetical protein
VPVVSVCDGAGHEPPVPVGVELLVVLVGVTVDPGVLELEMLETELELEVALLEELALQAEPEHGRHCSF